MRSTCIVIFFSDMITELGHSTIVNSLQAVIRPGVAPACEPSTLTPYYFNAYVCCG